MCCLPRLPEQCLCLRRLAQMPPPTSKTALRIQIALSVCESAHFAQLPARCAHVRLLTHLAPHPRIRALVFRLSFSQLPPLLDGHYMHEKFHTMLKFYATFQRESERAIWSKNVSSKKARLSFDKITLY